MGTYDFGGYATRNDLVCSDKRIIRRDAFKDNDGTRVPLVWNHIHDDPTNVIGHADLENRPDGVYAYCSFNDSNKAIAAKEAVRHNDVASLSIYANHLVEKDRNVLHGMIREVSLVLAGANPGATIEQVAFQHSDGSVETLSDEAIILAQYPVDVPSDGESLEFEHADDTKKDVTDEEDSSDKMKDKSDSKKDEEMSDDQKKKSESDDSKEDSDESKPNSTDEDTGTDEKDAGDDKPSKNQNETKNDKDKTSPTDEDNKEDKMANEKTDGNDQYTLEDVQKWYEGLDDKAKTFVQYLVGAAVQQVSGDEDEDKGGEAAQSDENYGGSDMYHNAFDGAGDEGITLTHSDVEQIKDDLFASAMNDMQHGIKLHDSLLSHAEQDYGIGNIEVLFPDAKNITQTPQFLQNQNQWVADFMNRTTHTPFAKIRTTIADITADEARAKGYMKKGAKKTDEFFQVAKRETDATTVYKKQRIDRDDILDITDFDALTFISTEMRGKLTEEIARAALIGDGRSADNADKIREDRIRPIVSDNSLFAIKVNLSQKIDYAQIIEEIAYAHSVFQGSGVPTLYTSPTNHVRMSWVKNTLGERIYKTDAELCAALNVEKIVDVFDMDSLKVVDGDSTYEVFGIKVNPMDYNMGTNKGGEITSFQDFDIDYNQQKMLIETRLSGTLVKPWSAEVIRFNETTAPKALTIDKGSLTDLITVSTGTASTTEAGA
jgi:hypothetical protein